jgi:hypothetical protein
MGRHKFSIGDHIRRKGSSITWKILEIASEGYVLIHPTRDTITVDRKEVQSNFKLA